MRMASTVRAAGEDIAFYGASVWAAARTRDQAAINRLTDRGLTGTSGTAVLIGSAARVRPGVIYEIEIEESYRSNEQPARHPHQLD